MDHYRSLSPSALRSKLLMISWEWQRSRRYMIFVCRNFPAMIFFHRNGNESVFVVEFWCLFFFFLGRVLKAIHPHQSKSCLLWGKACCGILLCMWCRPCIKIKQGQHVHFCNFPFKLICSRNCSCKTDALSLHWRWFTTFFGWHSFYKKPYLE